jgi:hypothetical protein
MKKNPKSNNRGAGTKLRTSKKPDKENANKHAYQDALLAQARSSAPA